MVRRALLGEELPAGQGLEGQEPSSRPRAQDKPGQKVSSWFPLSAPVWGRESTGHYASSARESRLQQVDLVLVLRTEQ